MSWIRNILHYLLEAIRLGYHYLRNLYFGIAPLFYGTVLTVAVLATVIVCFSMWIISQQKLKIAGHPDLSFFSAIVPFAEISIRSISKPNSITASDVALVSEYATVYIFLLNILAILFSSLYILKERLRIHRGAPYFSTDIRTTHERLNQKAVAVMLRYYRAAEAIQILSGDYDWLFEDSGTNISNVVAELVRRNEAELMSYKSPRTVLDAWKRKPDSKQSKVIFQRIRFWCPVQIKASLISTRSGGKGQTTIVEIDGVRPNFKETIRFPYERAFRSSAAPPNSLANDSTATFKCNILAGLSYI